MIMEGIKHALNWLGLDNENPKPKVFDWDAYYKDIANGVNTRIIESKFSKTAYYIDAPLDDGC